VALNICYEDVFGEEIIRSLPAASLLVNLSNTAWFGNSLAQPQHLQMARVRALETGRFMLRATNTGMTAAVDPQGQVIAQLAPFTTGALVTTVRGYEGATPYARWGNALALAMVAAAFLPAFLYRRRNRLP
jgi:apolipoprotein N-acyltransferase